MFAIKIPEKTKIKMLKELKENKALQHQILTYRPNDLKFEARWFRILRAQKKRKL